VTGDPDPDRPDEAEPPPARPVVTVQPPEETEMPETKPIRVLTDNDEVPQIVRTAAELVRKRGTEEAGLLADLLVDIGDELADHNAIEVHNPNRAHCRDYVVSDYGADPGEDSDVWTAALALARAITDKDG